MPKKKPNLTPHEKRRIEASKGRRRKRVIFEESTKQYFCSDRKDEAANWNTIGWDAYREGNYATALMYVLLLFCLCLCVWLFFACLHSVAIFHMSTTFCAGVLKKSVSCQTATKKVFSLTLSLSYLDRLWLMYHDLRAKESRHL